MTNSYAPLVDTFGRVHKSLRVSVTDVCNIRCLYCMPADGAEFLPNDKLLTYDQIAQFSNIVALLGINKIRITGGEPLTRANLHELIGKLKLIDGIDELALTTNGMLLAREIDNLVRAGLTQINISLDTLSEETFRSLARRDGLNRVLEGIEAACGQPKLKVKLNALVLRDVNLGDVVELVQFARSRDISVRFIEFMPLDAAHAWSDSRMVAGEELRELISRKISPLEKRQSHPSAPATEYGFADGKGSVGFIDSVSKPFCGGCDRLRLTAEGQLRNCLFGQEEWNVGEHLQQEHISAEKIIKTIRDCIGAKHASHGISQPGFKPPERAMYQIGG